MNSRDVSVVTLVSCTLFLAADGSAVLSIPAITPSNTFRNAVLQPSEKFKSLGFTSFVEAERRLYTHVLAEQEEVMYASDGVQWIDLTQVSTKYNVDPDVDRLHQFMSYSRGQTIFLYHTHPYVDMQGEVVLHPPSKGDVASHILFQRMARRAGKNVVSRVVDGFGVWQYSSQRDDLPEKLPLFFELDKRYYPGLPERMRTMVRAGDPLDDGLVAKLKDLYQEYQWDVSFRRFTR